MRPPRGALSSSGVALLDVDQDAANPWPGRGALDDAPALDMHEGIGDPLAGGGCQRWPETLRLLASTGELVRGRCGATNLCRYCQRLYVVETVEMLTLDALEHAPTLWVVLTAREHLTRDECRDHLRQLRKATRKLWPGIEWFVQVEFQRRGALHLNLLVKGVPIDQVGELRDVLVERWCARVDALPVGQWAGVVEDAGGAVRYLAKMLAHGLKAEQAPPIGWRGHRTSQTRGYLVRPASVMRVEAREALQAKRDLWRLSEAIDDPHELELALHERREARRATTWTLYRLPLLALVQDVRERPRNASVLDAATFAESPDGTAPPESGANARAGALEDGGGPVVSGPAGRSRCRQAGAAPPSRRGGPP